jgi:hypothetical protein
MLIAGEGAASAWEQVHSLLGDAVAEAEGLEWGPSGAERSARIDDELARAGIAPGDPSLYPDRESGMTEDGR